MTDPRKVTSHSAHVHPTIDRHGGPGHIGRAVRSEEADHLGDLFRLPQATQRNLAQQRFALGFRQLAGHVGVDEARRHRIHGNGTRTDFPGQRTGEALQAGLRRGIVGLPGIAHGADHGTDVDDAPQRALVIPRRTAFDRR